MRHVSIALVLVSFAVPTGLVIVCGCDETGKRGAAGNNAVPSHDEDSDIIVKEFATIDAQGAERIAIQEVERRTGSALEGPRVETSRSGKEWHVLVFARPATPGLHWQVIIDGSGKVTEFIDGL